MLGSGSGNCCSLQRARIEETGLLPCSSSQYSQQTVVPGQLAESRWLTSPLLLLHDMNLLLFPSTHPSVSIYCCVWSGREPFLFMSIAIWWPWGLVPAWNSFNSCHNSSSWETYLKAYWEAMWFGRLDVTVGLLWLARVRVFFLSHDSLNSSAEKWLLIKQQWLKHCDSVYSWIQIQKHLFRESQRQKHIQILWCCGVSMNLWAWTWDLVKILLL